MTNCIFELNFRKPALCGVANGINSMNKFGMDISSIFIDPHDATGNTANITVAGAEDSLTAIQVAYRTTDGGAHWAALNANLPETPASSILVDPQNADTVYIATDEGVYFTTNVASCAQTKSNCWSVFGTGLPAAPVVALSASPAGASSPMLVAATYGRGIWQSPLWTASTSLTAAAASPTTLTFASQLFGTASSAHTGTLQNTGSNALTVTSISMTGDFRETDTCVNARIAVGASCSAEVTFKPSGTGSRTGQMTISANVYGGQMIVDMTGTGTGTAAGAVTLTPPSIDFGEVEVGTTSAPMQVQAGNSSGVAIPINAVAITSPYKISSNACGTTTLAANSSCQLLIRFAPTQPGAAAGTLTFTDGAGTQTVGLNGTGAAAATDVLNPTALNFSATAAGQLSTAQTITLTNTGDLTLTAIGVSANGDFQTSNNCGTQLTGHAACTIRVVFAPTQLGTLSGTLTINDALRTQTAALSGTGVSPAALNVNPTSLNFSTQQPGVAGAPQILTISNTGGVPLANAGFQITGPAAASYSIGATTCGPTLSGGGSCTVQVIFTPAATGPISASLTVTSSTLGVTPVSVSLNGTGQLSNGLGGNPAMLTFPAVGVGQSSTAMPVTISNNSSYAISSLALAVNGPFTLTQNTCTSSLAAGANCTAGVIFQPTASGAATGALTVTSTSVTMPANVALSGMGFDFAVAVSGSSSLAIAAGQTANYGITIIPASGAQGNFTYTCGTLPANALCLFNPTTTTVSAGATGNVNIGISTGKPGLAFAESPAGWRMLPLTCGLLLLPLAFIRRRKNIFLIVLFAAMAGSISSCTASGGGTSSGSNGSGSASATPPGTYTIPVTVSSTGISHAVTVTMTVD